MLARLPGRLLQMIPTFILIGVVVFVLIRLLPGNPAAALLGIHATPEALARINAQLGFNRPIWVQFLLFVGRLLHGDLGISVSERIPVTEVIARRLPVTLALVVMAAAFALILALPLAFVAALRQNRASDVALRGVFQVGLSTPVFYIGLLMLGFLGAQLHWFPVGGIGSGFWSGLYHLILPALTLGVGLAAILMRSLRSTVIGVLRAEYVEFARAKGIAPWRVLTGHVLRNSLITTLALFGLNIGTLLGNTVIVENVFAVPGIGGLLVEAIFGRDYPVVQGVTLVLAVMVSIVFLLTDIAESWLDPRLNS
ncbi:MAG: ABC transporter permease [Proteobacteria bacterium]|nr:ABC transporter permease [Pseudomonadota bacterium]